MNDMGPHVDTIEETEEDNFVYNGESKPPAEEEEEEEEEFVYPGVAESASAAPPTLPNPVSDSEPVPLNLASDSASSLVSSPQPHPTPAQLESSYAAASSGDLPLLKKIFTTAYQTGGVSAFSLANDASARTGLTALHAAASRGYEDIVRWLIETCGAMPDLEDKEGETALHKASLNGHLSIVKYLVPSRAAVNAQDADGWTALHNACSKGYLDIVRYLCEDGGMEAGTRTGVDIQSKAGWTPLMNASSKGHLPVVRYLLSKQHADPLVRNNWGETAYDVAAAVFEIWICEILEKAEEVRWNSIGDLTSSSVYNGNSNGKGSRTSEYNPLAIHTTISLILYENQRLDTRLKTLARTGGKPKFAPWRKAPFELKELDGDSHNHDHHFVAVSGKSSIHLPLRDSPYSLPNPSIHPNFSHHHPEGVERSHFWLSDWTLDFTHPRVDAEQGWQYARSFEDPDEMWSSGPSALSRDAGSETGHRIPRVRRRRWVRVMRRRLDIPPLPFLFPDGGMYYVAEDGGLVRYQHPESPSFNDLSFNHSEQGQELASVKSIESPSKKKARGQDYVARARYLVGSQTDNNELSPLDARRSIAKLERATMELTAGLVGDTDIERKTQAEVLLNTYTRELDRQRANAEAQGLGFVQDQESTYPDDENFSSDEEDDDDESFHYPISPTTSTNASNTKPSNRPSLDRNTSTIPDLTQHLSLAPDFRVPTHEAPQQYSFPQPQSQRPFPGAGGGPRTGPTPHYVNQWEKDEDVSQCRECRRKFGFLLRRHCRRCGKIFCDKCSSYRALLDPDEIVHEPGSMSAFAGIGIESRPFSLNRSSSSGSSSRRSNPSNPNPHRSSSTPSPSIHRSSSSSSPNSPGPNHPSSVYSSSPQRVCQTCFDETSGTLPTAAQGILRSAIGMERVFVDQERLSVPINAGTIMRRQTSSQLSDLAECPVCNTSLDQFETAAEQEAHVKNCLEGGSGNGPTKTQQAGKYLVYRLPAESMLVGVECVICLEEFVKGSMVARLSCFCSFHNACLSSWLQRGKACPVHAR